MNKRNVCFADCTQLERFTGADYCDKNGLLAYAVSTYEEEKKGKVSRIILKNLETSEECVVSGGAGEGSPSFNPNGNMLLYLSAKGGMGRQIFVKDLENGKERQITYMYAGAIDPIWAPDGSKILFASPCSGTEDEGTLQSLPYDDINRDDTKKDCAARAGMRTATLPPAPIVIEDFGYKFDGLGFIRPESHMHLWVVDLQGGSARRLTEGAYNYLHHNWTANSKGIICESNRFRSKKESLGFDLLKIELNGAVTRLTEKQWLVSYPNPMRPVCTPDGKYAIAGCMDETITEAIDKGNVKMSTYPSVYLYRVALDGSEIKKIFVPDEKLCYQCVQFPYNAGCGWGLDKLQVTEDGKHAVFMSGYQGQGNLYIVDIYGDGHAAPLVIGKQVCHGISKIKNGKFLVAQATDVLPEAYYLYDLQTRELSEKIAQSAEEYLEQVKITMPEDFSIKSLDGDTQIHGWVLPPAGFDSSKKYPAILYVHGGPHPFYTYGFTPEHHALATEGFYVLWCNPRGTSGYGWNHQNIDKAFDGTAFYDCLQFVDEAVKRYPSIDSDRIGVTGGSYGGYMVNYMATHCNRFKAYVTQRSIANNLISYASSDMQGTSAHFDSFRDFMLAELEKSPVSYAERVNVPLLILHGANDYRTPVEGAHQLYVAIKDTHPNLPVKMVIYPHTAHEQPTNPKLLAHYYRELADWFKKYL